MKKTVNYSILTTLALLLTLGSCVSENMYIPMPDDGAERTVSLRLATAEATTRGVNRPVCDGEPVRFTRGMLYLVTSTGVIDRHFQVTPIGGTATDITTGGNTINMACLNTGVPIEGVPGNVNRVVMVGNSNGWLTLPTVGNINSVISRTVRAESQMNEWPFHGVSMFANEPLVYNSTNSVWEADMVLAPIVARFELGQMTGMGQIESFSLEGIFIDRHFGQATLDGNFYPSGATPVIRGSANSATNFARNALHYGAPAVFTGLGWTRYAGALITYYATNLPAEARTKDGVIIRPSTLPNPWTDGPYTWGDTCPAGCCAPGTTVDRVWNFQVFARDFVRSGGAPTPATTTPPILVIRLTDVVVRTGIGAETQNIGTQYLTVASFNRRNDNGTFSPLNGIRASNVYRIRNLVFDERDLHTAPHVHPIAAEITVELAEWDGRPTEHDGFRQLNPIGGEADNGAFAFELGAAFNGGCTGDNSMVYLWQRSTNPNVWPTPDINNAVAAPNYSVTGLTATTYFRRVAWCACGARSISAMARVEVEVPLYLYVTPSIQFLNTADGGGTRTVYITTNAPSWTVERVDTSEGINWLNIPSPASGNQGTLSFTASINNSANTGNAPRHMSLRVRVSPTLYRYVAVSQLGQHEFIGAAQLNNSFVGAFWRHNQFGERLIHMTNTSGGTWSVFTSHDWIVVDTAPSPNIATCMFDDPVLHRLPATAGRMIENATGNDIRFRIGLRNIGDDRPTSAAATPRWGQVVVRFGPNQRYSHVIWIHHGEAAHYVMTTDDATSDMTRAVVRRWSPFNLMGPTPASNGSFVNVPQRVGSAGGGSPVRFPSQAGAFFQWSSNNPRRAWATAGSLTVAWSQVTGTNNTAWWDALEADHETCPPGYRRPRSGATNAQASPGQAWANPLVSLPLCELRQSLWMSNDAGRGNSSWGFYADGFFDRHTRNPNHIGPGAEDLSAAVCSGAGRVVANTTVAFETANMANIGRLFFNPRTGYHLFLPAAGQRNASGNIIGGSIRPRPIGSFAYFMSSSAQGGDAWSLWIGNDISGMHSQALSRRMGFSIRCVRE